VVRADPVVAPGLAVEPRAAVVKSEPPLDDPLEPDDPPPVPVAPLPPDPVRAPDVPAVPPVVPEPPAPPDAPSEPDPEGEGGGGDGKPHHDVAGPKAMTQFPAPTGLRERSLT
jgi:hypothetical protein